MLGSIILDWYIWLVGILLETQSFKEKWPCEIWPVGVLITRQFSFLGPFLLYLDPIIITIDLKCTY